MQQHSVFKDSLILGFAIFSMYFGAGNVIFPPYLGLTSSSDWQISFFAYFLADMGFATVAMFALLKMGGNVENLMGKIGRKNGMILMSIIILCIGPLIALPRTGAVAYEMLLVPYMGKSITSSIVASIFYFGLIMIFTFRPTSMLEILGKVLSPLLFIALVILIIKGFFTPIGEIKENLDNHNLFFDGLILGYQTLDVLAALAFGIIIVKILRQKGYKDDNTTFKIVAMASLIAAFGIMLVYYGLTYLGATASTVFETDIEKVILLNKIIYLLFGSSGAIILSFVVFLACFTTGAALVSVTAEYFSKISKGRFSYKKIVVITSLFAIIVTNFGLETIINFAAPILFLVYPAAIVIILLSFFDKYIKNQNIYKFASFGTIFYSVFELLSNNYFKFQFIDNIPFGKEGLGWILPAIVFAFIGFLFRDKKSCSKE